MGTFSTNAAKALEKVLKRSTLVDIKKFINGLERALDNYAHETANVEAEAKRILDVKTYLDGSEIIARGHLQCNLTRNLDGPDITRAISTATSVYNLMDAARKAWLLERKAIQQAGRHPPKWDDVMEKNRGPGVVGGAFKG